MLLETVTALARAGRAALIGVRPDGACDVSVSQLDQGRLSFPSLAVLRISGHPLRFVHVGADGELRHHLLALADADGRAAGAQVLAEDVLHRLIAELPGRYARGRIEHLALAPVSLGTRGVRSFGVRCRSACGQLFLLADVPSVAETERGRGSGALQRMADSCLPAGWATRDVLDEHAARGLVRYLRRSEADVHLLLPARDGTEIEKAAFLVDRHGGSADERLDFAVPVDAAMRGRLSAGTSLGARIGIADRSLECELVCRGLGDHALAGGLRLAGLSTGPPCDLRVVQSRRSFRIPMQDHVEARLRFADPGVGTLAARLADLSFNGARMVYVPRSRDEELVPGDTVRCRMSLPGMEQEIDVEAIVRRVHRHLDEAARLEVEVGLEFAGPGVRAAMGLIRQFVLGQQRRQLARRVQVTGVADW